MSLADDAPDVPAPRRGPGRWWWWVPLFLAVLGICLAVKALMPPDAVDPPEQMAGSRRFDRVTFCNCTEQPVEVTIRLLKHPPDPGEVREWCPEFTFPVGGMQTGSRLFSWPLNDDPNESVWRIECTATTGNESRECVLYPDTVAYGENEVHFRSATFWLGPRLERAKREPTDVILVGHGVMSNDRVGRHMPPDE